MVAIVKKNRIQGPYMHAQAWQKYAHTARMCMDTTTCASYTHTGMHAYELMYAHARTSTEALVPESFDADMLISLTLALTLCLWANTLKESSHGRQGRSTVR